MSWLHFLTLAEAGSNSTSEGLISSQIWGHLLAATIFSALGMFLLWAGYQVLSRIVPFSMRKEIEEDQNIALAIIVAAVILGISMIISAAIQG